MGTICLRRRIASALRQKRANAKANDDSTKREGRLMKGNREGGVMKFIGETGGADDEKPFQVGDQSESPTQFVRCVSEWKSEKSVCVCVCHSTAFPPTFSSILNLLKSLLLPFE